MKNGKKIRVRNENWGISVYKGQVDMVRMETEKEGLVRWQEQQKPKKGRTGREEKAC